METCRNDPIRGPVYRNRKKEEMRKSREMKRSTETVRNFSWPPLITDEIKKKCIEEYFEATSVKALKTYNCGICGIQAHSYDVVSLEDLPNKEKLLTSNFVTVLEEYDNLGYVLDSSGINGTEVTCCKECLYSLQTNSIPPCSVANNLQIGSCPPELMNLTIIEKILIAAFRTSICVIKFKEIAGTGTEQKGVKGQTITFPQDVESILSNIQASVLPQDPECLPDIIKVVFIGSKPPTRRQLLNVLQVRRKKVFTALHWLKMHHPQYSNITIDDRIINKLPLKGIPPTVWQTMSHSEETKVEECNHSRYTNDGIENVIRSSKYEDSNGENIPMESSGVIDVDVPSVTSVQESVAAAKHLLDDDSDHSPKLPIHKNKVNIIPHGSLPVCEYSNPKMWTGGYPWLFPFGMGGPEDERESQLSFHKWMRYLLNHHFSRFREEHAFIFHVYNVLQKREISLHTAMIVRQPRFSSTAARLSTLTSKQLDSAMASLANENVQDPIVKLLLDQIYVVGKRRKGSPYKKKSYRQEMHGIMIEKGMPCYWITLNPADVHSPVVAFLAGNEIDIDAEFPNVPPPRERARIVSQQPVACAKYFDITVKAFINCILRCGKKEGGVLGHVSAFYGVVEEQGRGSLHLHSFVWLEGYTSPTKLREQMIQDEDFKRSVLAYLENTIKQQSPYTDVVPNALSKDIGKDNTSQEQNGSNEEFVELVKDTVLTKRPPSTSDKDFQKKIKDELHNLAKYCNLHSHCFTCLKYKRVKTKKKAKKGTEDQAKDENEKTDEDNADKKFNDCRFGYPRKIEKETRFDGNEIVIKRLEQYTHNYEEVTLLTTRSNMSIDFIGSGKDARAATFYACNYQCKHGLTAHNTLPIVTAVIRNMDIGKTNQKHEGAINRSKAMIYKCANRLTSECEMSAAHVAHILLGNEDKYSTHKFKVLNILSFISLLDDDIVDDVEQQSRIQHGNDGIILLNDANDYMYRGDALSDYTLYEYTGQIEKVKIPREESSKSNMGRPLNQRLHFSDEHPQSVTHIQKIRSIPVIPRLTWFPPDEESNPEKFAMSMLILFKPFNNLSELKNGKLTWEEAYREFEIPEKHRQHVSNIVEMHSGLAEKRKLDEEKRANDDESSEFSEDDTYYYTEDESESEDFWEEERIKLADSHTSDDIVEAVKKISNFKRLEVDCGTHQSRINDDQVTSYAKTATVKIWKSAINELKNAVIDDSDSLKKRVVQAAKPQSFTGPVISKEHTSYEDVVTHVKTSFCLNVKQERAFNLIAQNVWKRLNGEEIEQKLVYLGGDGGTGKSQVIKALKYLHEILEVEFALKVSAYTGTASAEIGGSTLCSILQISKNAATNTDLRKLEKTWASVNTLIIDEVSMLSCGFLAKLHRQLVKGKHTSTTLPFGGLDILFVGDFKQFSPIHALSLYYGTHPHTPTKPVKKQSDVDRELGRSLWSQLTHVVYLTEQNRVTDQSYAELLKRIATGSGTEEDYNLLNTRLIENVDMMSEKFKNAPIVVPGNNLRCQLNRVHAIHNAANDGKRLLISKSVDSCTKFKLTPSKLKLLSSLSYTLTGSLPGELELFEGLSVMLTKNVAVELQLTNGTIGVVSRIPLEKKPIFSKDKNAYILQSVPNYVIVKFQGINIPRLPNLNEGEIPIFAVKSFFRYQFPGCEMSTSISRYQLPLVPSYSYTAYKAQSKTLNAIVTDLVPQAGVHIDPSFSYVPLSRVRSLQDLAIIRPFPKAVLQAKRPKDLIAQEDKFQIMDAKIA